MKDHVTVGIFLVFLHVYAFAEICPIGHEAVKQVPILYGLPNDSEELHQKLANHEIVLGGCIVSDDSPKFLTICTLCGIELRGKTWVLEEINVENSDIGFPQRLLELANTIGGNTQYSLEVEEGGNKVFRVRIQLKRDDNEHRDLEKFGLSGEITEMSVKDDRYKMCKGIDEQEKLEVSIIEYMGFTLLEISPVGKNTWANKQG
jgi:hypothetical protein